MSYDNAVAIAWQDLEKITQDKKYSVRFLSDEYDVDFEKRIVYSLSCNIPAKDYISVLILHYIAKKIKRLPAVTGEWISFKQLEGGEGYYPTFKKRVIDTIMRKYKDNPEALLGLIERLGAKKTQLADISVALEPLAGAPILINFWRGDEEFGPSANLLFDKSISEIYCTEDIVVLSETIAHSI